MNFKAWAGIAAVSLCALAAVAVARKRDARPPPRRESSLPPVGLAGRGADAPLSLGGPRADLSASERAAHLRGLAQFTRIYDMESGLGPLYSAVSCANCHENPTLGGTGDLNHLVVVGHSPGPTPDIESFARFAIPGFARREMPSVRSHLLPPPLYGLGLIEAIPDAFLLAAGCNGGTLHVIDGHVARFGTKPFASTVRGFVASALFDEMGITSNVSTDRPLGETDHDRVPDPEVGEATIRDLTAYVWGLAPPPSLPSDPRGQSLFVNTFGCATCHRPETGPGVRAYSDLCMHSMGPVLADGIVSHAADRVPLSVAEDGDEFRTKPLWGLRFRTRLLHDGRAASADEAIRLHGGDAASSVGRYAAASASDRAALLAFLNTL